jgi:hypothetical protein
MMKLLRSLCLLILTCVPTWSSEQSEQDTPYQTGLHGLQHYRDGEYAQAVPLLQEALERGELTFSLTYADICRRNLDRGKHSLSEAAEWYVAAANAGDADALSYLHTLLTVRDEDEFDTRVSELRKVWIEDEANRGFGLYQTGDYVQAAQHLKKAAIENHPLAQELYADICLRELDGKPRTLKEAAMWYLLSAKGGDPQSHSYLESIISNIFEIPHPNAQMESIVGKWVYDLTFSKLTPIPPKDINGYLVFQFGRKIDRTTAQKLPYFFDKFTNALLCSVGMTPLKVIEEDADDLVEAEPALKIPAVKSCAAEYEQRQGRHFIKQSTTCFTFGPVYFKYFQSLDSNDDNLIPKPKKSPSPSVVYQFILRALQEVTKGKNAKQLTSLSHQEYPWLLAGLKFWRTKHPRKAWAIDGYSEQELLRTLTYFHEVLPEETMGSLLKLVEVDDIWPNKKEDPIALEFDENVRRFFACPISTGCQFVQQMHGIFFESLTTQTLDLKDKNDLEILQTPLLMYHCEYLVLTNINSTQGCYNALSQAQRHFGHLLRLNFRLMKTFKEEVEYGRKILKIIHKVEKRGFKVIREDAG